MNRVAILTIYHVPNYGSVLQTYATQKIIESLGYQCDIIRYKYPNEWHYKKGLRKPTLKDRLIHLLGIKPTHRKPRILKRFIKTHLSLTKEYKKFEDLKSEAWEAKYSLVAVGSDQVWNPKFNKGDAAFQLSFLPKGFPRISIASSFASSKLDCKFTNQFRKNLSAFNYLSVREAGGVRIIKDLLGKEAPVQELLDPTLILKATDWQSLLVSTSDSHPNAGKKFILVYGLYYAFDPRPDIFHIVEHLYQTTGYDVIFLDGVPKKSDRFSVPFKDFRDATVEEFLKLFFHAEIVVTSSFHGTAFALNFEKKLIAISIAHSDDRIRSLLVRLGAEAALYLLNSNQTSNQQPFDTSVVRGMLQKEREQSLNWIKQALK